jgi:hypothetical protein
VIERGRATVEIPARLRRFSRSLGGRRTREKNEEDSESLQVK